MRKTHWRSLSKDLNIHPARALEAKLKAELISAILAAVSKRRITHAKLALDSGIPRSAVTGILSGSLQRVSLDRILRLLEAANLTAELRIREAA